MLWQNRTLHIDKSYFNFEERIPVHIVEWLYKVIDMIMNIGKRISTKFSKVWME